MVAISRSKTKIYIADAGTAASALTDSDVFEGDIKTYDKSGGNKDVESDAVFGGYVDKEKPTDQVEISFEIVPSLGTNADRWDAMTYAADVATGVYTMAEETSTQPSERAVFIQALNGTDYKSIGFNNCSVTVLDMEHSADDNRTYNMTLKFSPTTSTGVSNFMTLATAVTSLPAWTALDNN